MAARTQRAVQASTEQPSFFAPREEGAGSAEGPFTLPQAKSARRMPRPLPAEEPIQTSFFDEMPREVAVPATPPVELAAADEILPAATLELRRVHLAPILAATGILSVAVIAGGAIGYGQGGVDDMVTGAIAPTAAPLEQALTETAALALPVLPEVTVPVSSMLGVESNPSLYLALALLFTVLACVAGFWVLRRLLSPARSSIDQLQDFGLVDPSLVPRAVR